MNSTEERIRIPHLRVVSEDRRSQFSARRCGSCILLLSIQSQIVAVQPKHPEETSSARVFTSNALGVSFWKTLCCLVEPLSFSLQSWLWRAQRLQRKKTRQSFLGLGSARTHLCSLPRSACRTTSWIVPRRKSSAVVIGMVYVWDGLDMLCECAKWPTYSEARI
jgi:hypothetical protein